ncbi:MAG: hypothetical protein EA363_00440 [Balneolaceae bacterium]|nr:MAG: hypothetical protein EA363_00440 [Balneolaceae bacterium]
MVWPDMEFDDEINHPYSRRRPRDPVAFDHEMFDWYAMLARLHGEREALRTGSFRLAAVSDEHAAFAFSRVSGTDFAIVIINRGDEDFTLEYGPEYIDMPRRVFDQITGESFRVRRGEVQIQVPPRSARIITP